MDKLLLFIAIIIFVCVVFQRASGKIGVPGLFLFILLGMLFGADGVLKIPFDNFSFANSLCSIALIFIMFYGGAGTKWSAAKPVALKSILLSSVGTVLTAGFVGLFCYFVLKIKLLESFLIGAVICSTDAASVFSILRSKKMNLKYSTASLLEVESGSNDPFSYMLTVVLLSLIGGEAKSPLSVASMLVVQIAVGVICGFAFAYAGKFFLNRFKLKESGFDAAFIVAIALGAYAVPTLLGGNGYLSVYIAGIIIGNSRIPNKSATVHFFDGATGLMQMLLFFLLGLLSLPSKMPAILLTALFIALFLTFIARPAAVFLTLSPFKCRLNQQLFVSWAGMRGAASIVFAIMAVTGTAAVENDIFHIVFFIVLFSILFQGTLLPLVAKKLNMIDETDDVMKTFTDYAEDTPVQFIQFKLKTGHPWEGKLISDITLPPQSILVLIVRGEEKIVPKGQTMLEAGDKIILSGREGGAVEGVSLYEKHLDASHKWVGKRICDIPSSDCLIIFVKRKGDVLIPSGDTLLMAGDELIINDTDI